MRPGFRPYGTPREQVPQHRLSSGFDDNYQQRAPQVNNYHSFGHTPQVNNHRSRSRSSGARLDSGPSHYRQPSPVPPRDYRQPSPVPPRDYRQPSPVPPRDYRQPSPVPPRDDRRSPDRMSQSSFQRYRSPVPKYVHRRTESPAHENRRSRDRSPAYDNYEHRTSEANNRHYQGRTPQPDNRRSRPTHGDNRRSRSRSSQQNNNRRSRTPQTGRTSKSSRCPTKAAMIRGKIAFTAHPAVIAPEIFITRHNGYETKFVPSMFYHREAKDYDNGLSEVSRLVLHLRKED